MVQALIVDDSTFSRMLVQKIIEEHHPDWQVCLAKDAEDALAQTQMVDDIDVAIVDFNMPGMNGIEFANKLRQQYSHCQIALLTANIQDPVRNRAETAGITFINKPITESLVTEFTKSIR